jgi:hypothetical protein
MTVWWRTPPCPPGFRLDRVIQRRGELRFALLDSLIKSENDRVFKEVRVISLLPGDMKHQSAVLRIAVLLYIADYKSFQSI